MSGIQTALKSYFQSNVEDRFGASSWIQPAYRAIAAEVALDEGAFLDLRAAGGWICIHVAAGKPELDAIGIVSDEDDERAADLHKQRRLNVTFRQMQPQEVTYPEDTFQAVLAHMAIQHFEDVSAVIAEAHRVLSPGGRMLIYDPVADAEMPVEWIVRRSGWPPESLVRRHLAANAMSDVQWSDLKARIKKSPFGGGREGTHGFYRRIVLQKD